MKKALIFSGIIIFIVLCFTSCKYTVDFDENGGDYKPQSIEVSYDKFYSLPIPQKAGYKFLGWFYNDETTPIDISGNWPFKEDVTLVAKWEYMEYRIYYDLNAPGEDINKIFPNRVEGYNSDTPTFKIENPKRKGQIFLHWVDASGNIYEEYIVEQGTNKNIELTAVWWNFEEAGVIYKYNEAQDTLSVRTYSGSGIDEIIIPSELHGRKVTTISVGAFQALGEKVANQERVYRVYLPSSITLIEKNAFNRCNNIKVVLDVKSNDNYLELASEWIEKVVIVEEGNKNLADVILLKRPMIDSSEYVKIEE